MSSMLGGKKKSTSTTTNTVNVPDWALGGLQQAMSMAQSTASTPYEAYSDPRFAGFNQDELNSFQGVRNIQGQYQPAFDQAGGILNTVAQSGLNGFSQQQLDQYMNPYMTNVMDVQRGRAVDNYDQQMNDYRARAGQSASFGGSRFGLGEAQMQENFQRQLAESETLGLASAYESGLAGAERGMARAGQAGLSMADLATQNQGLAYQDYTALNAQGGQQRALDQAGLDFNYEQWLAEKAHPYDQANFLAGIASPIAGQVSGSTSNQTQTQTDGQGWLQKAIGLASMAAAPFTGGASLMGSMGSLASSFGGGLATAVNSAGRAAGAMGPFQDANMFGRYAEGGQVTQGGAGPAWVESQYSPIHWGNKVFEWAKENPLEAAGTAMMAVPAIGPLSRGLGAIAGRTGMGKKAASGLAGFIAKHPKLAVGAGGAGLLGLGNALEETPETVTPEFDPADSDDIYDMQQYMAYLASNGKVGKFSKDIEEDKDGKYVGLLNKYPQLNPGNTTPRPEETWMGKAMGVKPSAGEGLGSVGDTGQESFAPITDLRNGDKPVQTIEEGLASMKAGNNESKFNMPLFMFGARMLQSQGDFFQAMGSAGEGYGSDEQAAARQRFEDSIELYKLEQGDRKIQNNEKWQEIQAQQMNNPYTQLIKSLKAQQMMQKLNQDPNAKMKLDAWKAMQANPIALNTPEGKQLNTEVMQMLSGGQAVDTDDGLPEGFIME